MDFLKFWCALCELDWDVWGHWSDYETFIPDDPDDRCCPNCLRVGVPAKKENLA